MRMSNTVESLDPRELEFDFEEPEDVDFDPGEVISNIIKIYSFIYTFIQISF